MLTLAPLAALRGVDTALAALVHALLGDYLGFIAILFALYVVAGGIVVSGTLARHAAGQRADARCSAP